MPGTPIEKAAAAVRPGSLVEGMTAVAAALLAFFLATAAPAQPPPPPLAGFYGGGFGEPGDFAYTQIELEEQGQTVTGRIYQPYQRADSPAIERLERNGQRLRFEAAGLGFDLHRTATGFEGSVRTTAGEIRPAYFAVRPGSPPAELLATVEGSYDLGAGRVLSLSRNNDGGGFWYLELPSGRTGFLFNLSDTEFVAGPCLYCAGPEYLHLSFTPAEAGGMVRQVAVRIDGRERIATRAPDFREEPVSFVSADGTRLAGSLFLPARGRRHPAVVLVHGSGGQSRNGFFGHIRFLAQAYARQGIAVLAYDKRGTGGSQGDWEQAGLATLADDAAAALRFLAARPDIRRRRLGLSGSSQAGWIVPMAASRYPAVRILQIRSGSAPMGVRESERRRLVRQMRIDGFGQADIDRAMRVRELMDEYAATGRGWDALAAAAAPVADTFWMRHYIGGLPARDHGDWAWLREAFGYDVAGDLAGYRGHVQILLGGSDALIDPALPEALARAALAGGRAREAEIEVVANATHNGLDGRTGGEREFPGLTRFVPGWFDRIVDWADERLR